jgi:hypothetical protein
MPALSANMKDNGDGLHNNIMKRDPLFLRNAYVSITSLTNKSCPDLKHLISLANKLDALLRIGSETSGVGDTNDYTPGTL